MQELRLVTWLMPTHGNIQWFHCLGCDRATVPLRLDGGFDRIADGPFVDANALSVRMNSSLGADGVTNARYIDRVFKIIHMASWG